MSAVASSVLLVAPTLSLTAAGAKAALTAAEGEALRNRWAVSIAVTDAAGDLMAFHRMDGAMRLSAALAQRKARTVAIAEMPSKAIEEKLQGGDLGVLMAPEIIAAEGGAPITAGGVIVGAIGVSGVASHLDAQIAQAGADAISTSAPPS
jgi:glc operon protein GlcG